MKLTDSGTKLKTAIALAIALTTIGWLLGPVSASSHGTVLASVMAPGAWWIAPAHAQDAENLHVNEDLVIPFGEVLDGDVQVLRGDLVVEKGARVEGDVLVVAGDCEVDGEIDGGVAVIGGSFTVSGAVYGDVLAAGPEAAILGEVDGNVVASGEVRLGPNAIVTGDVTSPGDLDREQGAIVLERDLGTGDGGLDVSVPFADDKPPTSALVVAGLFAILLPALFAALVAAIAAGTVRQVDNLVGRRGAVSLVLGVLAWAALPFLMVVILPLAPIVFCLFLVLAAVGFVGIAARVGRRLRRNGRLSVQAGVGGAALGLPIALGMVAGPWLGGTAGQIVFGAALVVGFGLAALAVGAALIAAFEAGSRARQGGDSDPGGQPVGDPEPDPAEMPSAGSLLTTTAAAGAIAEANQEHVDAPTEPMPAMAATTRPPDSADDSVLPPKTDITNDDSADAGAPAISAATALTLGDDGAADGDETLAETPIAPVDTPVDAPVDTPIEAPGETTSETPGVVPAEAPDELAADAAPTDPSVGPDAPISVLPGVQPLYAYLLGQAGIHNVGDLAAAEPEAIVAMTDQAGVTPLDATSAASWIAEARRAIE